MWKTRTEGGLVERVKQVNFNSCTLLGTANILNVVGGWVRVVCVRACVRGGRVVRVRVVGCLNDCLEWLESAKTLTIPNQDSHRGAPLQVGSTKPTITPSTA